MTETNEHQSSQGAETRRYASSGSHVGLVLGAAILISAGVIVAGGYGIRSGSLVFQALALEGALAALAVWLCLHASRIRQRISDAREWDSQEWDEPEDENVTLQDVQHARKIHYFVLAIPATTIIGLLGVSLLWTQAGRDAGLVAQTDTAAASVICLVTFCLWLVMFRSFQAADKDHLPEGPALMLAFRDVQWATLLVALGVLGSKVWPEKSLWSPPEIWVARLLLIWVVIVAFEQIVRVIVARFRSSADEDGFHSPTHLLLREAVFISGNPIASLFETIEARFGVSFRSSWAIRFVRAAALPSLVLVVLMFWGLTSLCVVGTNELGVRESFGRIRGDFLPPALQSHVPWHFGQISDEPLSPGLHLKLPWPLGRIHRYPVKTVSVKPVGFASESVRESTFLWGTEHALDEFELMLGDGTEAVAANVMLYYKIHEDKQRFLDYVYHSKNPDEALEAYAYRALMEHTRSKTLDEVLSTNREEFANRVKKSIRTYVEDNRLGIDVVDVALINLHPPSKVAEEYLDVIAAGIDAERFQIQANGEKLARIQSAEMERDLAVADAKVDAAQEVGEASDKNSEFMALSEAYAVAGDAFKLRLWFEALEEALADKPLVVVDKNFSSGSGETIIDLRSNGSKKTSQDPIPTGGI